MSSTIAVVLPLTGTAGQALQRLEALAAMPATPDPEVVLVDGTRGLIDDLLACVEGDVAVLSPKTLAGPAHAAHLALETTGADVLAVLSADGVPQPTWLGPLLAALADPGVVAASATPAGGTGVHGLALRREALTALPPLADASLETLALALAAQGRVVPVPASVVAVDSAARAARPRPGEPVELSIVIPTLDIASERLRRCLRTIEATVDIPHEVVVLHNGPAPQGYAAPVNAGLRAARAPYVVVTNDDVEFLPGWWAPLRAALDLGAAVAFPWTVGGFTRDDFAAWCFAMSRRTIETFGVAPGEFLDPEMVVHFQDSDLLLRLRGAGRAPVPVPESQIRHGLSETLQSGDPVLTAWLEDRVTLDEAAFDRKHPGARRATGMLVPS